MALRVFGVLWGRVECRWQSQCNVVCPGWQRVDGPEPTRRFFDTYKQNIGQHIVNVLEDKELEENSGVKYFFTPASDAQDLGEATKCA